MHFVMVGINHETAPVEYREKLAFSADETGEALAELRAWESVSEALLLSTCNRTELYVKYNPDAGETAEEQAEALRDFLRKQKDVRDVSASLFYSRRDESAIRHLYRVSAGLESMVKGESQILAQVREAYSLGCAARCCDFFLHKVMHTAFRVGKKARSETDIGIGAVSVSLAAVELAERIFMDLSKKRALVIGAGDMARLTAEHLISKGIAALTVTNRTLKNAETLADELGANAVPIEKLSDEIAGADVVVAATSSPDYLVTPEIMNGVMRERRNRQIYLIDVSVPRNISPETKKIYNVFAHDIDDLKRIVDRNLERRNAEVPKVERVVESGLESFLDWHASLDVAPTIKDLVGTIDAIRLEEIRKSAKYFDEEQLKRVDVLTRSLVKKILHHPITRLRESKKGIEDSPYWVDTVRSIFNLRKGQDG